MHKTQKDPGSLAEAHLVQMGTEGGDADEAKGMEPGTAVRDRRRLLH